MSLVRRPRVHSDRVNVCQAVRELILNSCKSDVAMTIRSTMSYTVEPDLIVTEMLALTSKSSRNYNDSDLTKSVP